MTTDCVGGVWTYAVELIRAIGSGAQFALATMGPGPSAAQRRQIDRLNVVLYPSEYRLEWMEEPWEDVDRAGDWLLEIEREFSPDVIHLNSYCHGSLAWRAPVMVVGHSCVLSWWEAVKKQAAPEKPWCEYRERVTRGVRAATQVVAPSRFMQGALQRHYGPLPRVMTIYNARDSARFWPQSKEPFVLSAGRLWDEAKNIGALARIAPRLPWPVCVAGYEQSPDGAGRARENVRGMGILSEPELADRMGRASIYVLPARYEPFGLSALEAALSGCALVLGEIPSLREVWGSAAVYVPPEDHEELARRVLELIDSPAKRARLASAAFRRALQFSPGEQARQYLAFYDELCCLSAERCGLSSSTIL